MTYVGIDISKATFVAAYPTAKGYQTRTFSNTPKGIRSFISTIKVEEHWCVMEATGNYCFLLLYLLDKCGFKASLVNPKKIKNYARMMMSVTKTDNKDACLIADFGERMKPESYKMPKEETMLLKQRRAVICQLKKQRTATINLHASLKPLPVVDKACLKSLEQTIHYLDKQIDKLEEELVKTAEQVYEKQLSLLTSIKGIGVTLATALIISTGGFTYFNNAKQLSRYIGLCPTIEQSGSSINIRGHINRNGDENLRSMLYIASWTAMRYNGACKETYERLRSNGKPAKVALIAVANKLVRQAFAVVKSDTSYIDGFVSTKPEHTSVIFHQHEV